MVCLALAACTGDGPAGPGAIDGGVVDATPSADAGLDMRRADAATAPRRCSPPPGVSARPRSIAEAVALANALPPPVTVACFLEALERPLHALATRSTISLQPAGGTRSPRIFLFSPELIMSITLVGKGARLVEFGEFVDTTRTLKGEIAFPITPPIAPSAAFDGITSGAGTTCRFCHREEEAYAPLAPIKAFVSGALAPRDTMDVELADVYQERLTCDPAAEPERCELLTAFFDHGEVQPGRFPEAIPTIFD